MRSAAVLVALVGLAGAVALAQSPPEGSAPAEPSPSPTATATTPEPSPTPTPTGGATTPDGPGEGLREVVDEGAGFAVSFPSEWDIITTVEPTMRLSVSAGGGSGFWVRAMPIRELGESLADREALGGISVESTDDLQRVRPLLDRLILEAETTVRVLQGPVVVPLGGLPTLAYVYHFNDPASEQVGVHAHYFAFLGPRVFVIVLQALPSEEFDSEMEAVFTRIADSFQLVTG